MIGHYLAVALQGLRRSPFTTAANVLTLALGLACFLAAFGIAAYWSSADDYHHDADRTYVLGQSYKPQGDGQSIPIQAVASAAPALHLASDFPQVEALARVHQRPKVTVAAGERKLLLNAAFAEPRFLDLFDFDFLVGDRKQALARPGGVVLTKSAAERLFGAAPAMGRKLQVAGKDAVVTGVIAPVRQPSFMGEGEEALLRFDVLARWDSSPIIGELDGEEEWFSAQGFTFLRLKEGASLAALNAALPRFVDRHMPKRQSDLLAIGLEAFPVGDITTRGLDTLLFSASGLHLTTTGVLIGLGLLILAVGGLNYANLATAQATVAAKQVGMRKVLGARPSEVMIQAWLSSLLQTSAAAVAALLLLAFAAPAVKSSTGIDMLFFLARPSASLLVAAGILTVAFAAGAYPALVMSRIRPVEALRSARSRRGPKFVTNLLVGAQFAAATFLFILLMVSHLQRQHLEAIAFPAKGDPVVVLNEVQGLGVDGQALVEVLRRTPGVKSAAVAERVPWTTSTSILPLARSPEDGARAHPAFAKHVGHDYFETLGFRLLAGRGFDREHETTTQSITRPDPSTPIRVVVDASYARNLGFASAQAAVGKTIWAPPSLMRVAGGSAAQPLEIIGVTEADPTWLGATASEGHIYLFGPDSPFGNGLYPILRLEPRNVRSTLAAVTGVWNQFSPDTPVDVRFLDQMFEASYRTYGRMAGLFSLLAGVAFVIASMGLVGIAVHVAARRRHEIAVRKTLGSTTFEAVRLLLVDFSKPVIVANLIAWPLGYLAAKAYLASFSQSIALSIWPFLLSLVVTLGVAWLVVGGQTWMAARVRPAQVLRDA